MDDARAGGLGGDHGDGIETVPAPAMDRLRALFPDPGDLQAVSRLATTLADLEPRGDAERCERLVCAVARVSGGSLEAWADAIDALHAGREGSEAILAAAGFETPHAHRGWVPEGMEIVRHVDPGMPGRFGAFVTATVGLCFLAVPVVVVAELVTGQPKIINLLVAIAICILPTVIVGTCGAALVLRWRNGIPGPATIRLDGRGWSAGPASGGCDVVKAVWVGPLDAWQSTWLAAITRHRTATEAGRRTVVLPLAFDHPKSSEDAVLFARELVALMRRAGTPPPPVQVLIGSRFRNLHEEPPEEGPGAEDHDGVTSGRRVGMG